MHDVAIELEDRPGVNILTLYSDHNHRMILIVDDYGRGRIVFGAWERDRRGKEER